MDMKWCLICWITNTLSAENDGLKVGNIPVLKLPYKCSYTVVYDNR